MFECKMRLIGLSDLMFGRHFDDPKRDDETHEQRELRTWPQKVRVTDSGQCYIQPFALKNGLRSAGKWLAMKMQGGGGKKTYTQRLIAGTLVLDKMLVTKHDGKPAMMKDIDPVSLFVPSNGRSGDQGTRVSRVFPTLHEWRTTASIQVFDNVITEDVMQRHLAAIGQFVGFGSMRVENGGINGRFVVKDFEWYEMKT